MARSHDASGARDEHDVLEWSGWYPAPGKRTLTQGLQLRAAPAATTPPPAAAATSAPAEPGSHAHDDPFGLHLAASAGVAGSGGAVPHADTIQPLMPGLDLSTVRAHSGDATDRALGDLGA